MKGAPSQQGGGGGSYGGMPAWLGMASQYFPQYFGGAGQTPQTGYMPPQGGSVTPGGSAPNTQMLGHPITPPEPPPAAGGAVPPSPPAVTGAQPTGLLGGAIAGAATPSNTMGQYGLLSGAPPQHSGWMPGYGGSRYGYGGGGQPGGIMPPPATDYMPPQGGYGLFGPFAQY